MIDALPAVTTIRTAANISVDGLVLARHEGLFRLEMLLEILDGCQ